MIVSHKHRFIFLKTRKTAGTSIELALRSFCGADDIITQVSEDDAGGQPHKPRNYFFPRSEWPLGKRLRWSFGWRPEATRQDMKSIGFFGHATADEIRGRLGDKVWSSYFKFTIERNPWDRQVSHYYWKIKEWADPPTFEKFVRSGFFIDNWPIYAIGDQIAADHIIQYDNLESGLGEALKAVGLATPLLPRAKASFRPQGSSYRTVYDEETRELVGKRYHREIEQFGWSF